MKIIELLVVSGVVTALAACNGQGAAPQAQNSLTTISLKLPPRNGQAMVAVEGFGFPQEQHPLNPVSTAVAATSKTPAEISPVAGTDAKPGALRFQSNAPRDYDFGRQLQIPKNFGEGEFTLELWVKLDKNFMVGPTKKDTKQQRLNWTDEDHKKYSGINWWNKGNFLLDGQNNTSGAELGSFSLQFFAGGCLRWLFGDGSTDVAGRVWAIQPEVGGEKNCSLLDDQWHQITLVRRWLSQGAALEMWIDGEFVADQAVSERVNMRSYWDDWRNFSAKDAGWVWGSEKLAAAGSLPQFEDYKGLIDEVRFWSRAKNEEEISANFSHSVHGKDEGLVGYYRMNEGAGPLACNLLTRNECIYLNNMKPGFWVAESAPLMDAPALNIAVIK